MKKPEHRANAIRKHWVAVYSSVDKFLTNNSGKFVSDKLFCLCEALNIRLKTSGAESPLSNGLIERHNLVPSEMLNKVLEDNGCSLIIALACFCMILHLHEIEQIPILALTDNKSIWTSRFDS